MNFLFRFFIPLMLMILPTAGKSQISEFGIFTGISGYKGELNRHMFTTDFSVYHPAVGLFLRRNTNAHWAYRINFLRGKVSGDDAHSESLFAKTRNLSFTSPVYELAFTLEFNFFPFEKYGSPYWATPYIFAGYAGFFFNPTVVDNGLVIKLNSLQTEGKNYSRLERAIPMGIGLKTKAGGWVFAIELSARKSTTDYLDDVSGVYLAGPKSIANPSPDTSFINVGGRQRGISKDKDWYMSLGLTVSHHIGNFRKRECQRLMNNQ